MIHQGDAIEVMAKSPSESVDAVVTDPPYNLAFMGRSWDAHPSPQKFQAWCTEWGREALRVTKPGGYLLAFGGTRTHHRLVCGLEDAGWIIRDELTWVYASGFPKGKANLKPAHEPIVLARKPGPLRPLAIDACRIPSSVEDAEAQLRANTPGAGRYKPTDGTSYVLSPAEADHDPSKGRWPSNLLLQDPELFDTANPDVVGSGAVAQSAGTYLNPDEPPDIGARGGGAGDGFLGGLGQSRSNAYANETGGYSRFFIIPQRYNGTCARCGRAISADSPSYQLRPSADSAPSPAPTEHDGTPDSTANATLPASPSTEPSTSATGRSTRHDPSPITESQPLTDASSVDESDGLTGTTTTTAGPSMCASCAEDAMLGSTQPPQSPTASEQTPAGRGEYPVALIVPKADRADREPVLRGQLPTNGKATNATRREEAWLCSVCGRKYPSGQDACSCGSTERTAYIVGKARENQHPTVKPVDLMRHLVRLVTPSSVPCLVCRACGGTVERTHTGPCEVCGSSGFALSERRGVVLDCFLGSGSTAIACEMEGFPWIGVEQSAEYVAIAEARLNGVQRGLGLDVPAPTQTRKESKPGWHQRPTSVEPGFRGPWNTPEPEEAA